MPQVISFQGNIHYLVICQFDNLAVTSSLNVLGLLRLEFNSRLLPSSQTLNLLNYHGGHADLTVAIVAEKMRKNPHLREM